MSADPTRLNQRLKDMLESIADEIAPLRGPEQKATAPRAQPPVSQPAARPEQPAPTPWPETRIEPPPPALPSIPEPPPASYSAPAQAAPFAQAGWEGGEPALPAEPLPPPLSDFERGEMAMGAGDHAQAATAFHAAASAARSIPDQIEALRRAADAEAAGGDVEQAVTTIDRLIDAGASEVEQNPALREPMAASLLTSGRHLAALGRTQDALSTADELLDWLGEATDQGLRSIAAAALADKVVWLGQMGDERAVACFDQLRQHGRASTLDPAPSLAVAHLLLARAEGLAASGRHDAALSTYGEIDERFGHDPSPAMAEVLSAAVVGGAQVFLDAGRPEEALAAMDHLRQTGRDAPDGLRVAVARGLADRAERLGDQGYLDAAIDTFDRTARRFRDDGAPDARAQAGRALLSQVRLLLDAARPDEAEARLSAWPESLHEHRGAAEALIARDLLATASRAEQEGELAGAERGYETLVGRFEFEADPALRGVVREALAGVVRCRALLAPPAPEATHSGEPPPLEIATPEPALHTPQDPDPLHGEPAHHDEPAEVGEEAPHAQETPNADPEPHAAPEPMDDMASALAFEAPQEHSEPPPHGPDAEPVHDAAQPPEPDAAPEAPPDFMPPGAEPPHAEVEPPPQQPAQVAHQPELSFPEPQRHHEDAADAPVAAHPSLPDEPHAPEQASEPEPEPEPAPTDHGQPAIASAEPFEPAPYDPAPILAARAALDAGDAALAAQGFSGVLADSALLPDNVKLDAHAGRAQALAMLGREADAFAELGLITEPGQASPDGPTASVVRALVTRGARMAEAGQTREALTVIDALLERVDANGPHSGAEMHAARIAALTARVRCYGQLGDDAVTISGYEALAALDRPPADLRHRVARLMVARADQLANADGGEAALAAFDAAERHFADDEDPAVAEQIALSRFGRAYALGRLGRGQEALAIYDDIVRLHAGSLLPALREQAAKALINRGIRLAELGDHEPALASFDEVIARFSDITDDALTDPLRRAFINRAEMLRLLGRPGEAATAIDLAVQRGAEGAQLHEQVSQLLYAEGVRQGELGEIDGAIETYAYLIDRFADSREPTIAEMVSRSLYNMAVRLGELDRNQEAVEAYDRLLARFGDNPPPLMLPQAARAMFNKALRLGVLGEGDAALAGYDQLIERFGGNATLQDPVARAMFSKASLLGDLGRIEEAVAVDQAVAARFGGVPMLREIALRARLHEAGLCERQGRTEAAAALYREVRETVASAKASSLVPFEQAAAERLATLEAASVPKPKRVAKPRVKKKQ